MLNEDKIKLMTSISMFEKERKKNVSWRDNILKAIISAAICSVPFLGYTCCWLALAGAWIVYQY